MNPQLSVNDVIKPSIRFSPFSDGWIEKKLGSVLEISNGKDYKHLKPGNIPVFGTGGQMLSVDEYLHDGESVFIGRKGSINKPFYYKGKFWTVDTLFYTHNFNGITPLFTNYLFQRINWLKHNEASGVPSLSKDTISKIKVKLPSVPEQQKIASFLSSVDEWIESLQLQKESLEKYKKGIMQKLFSQDIRFKDEDGKSFPDWETKQINQIMDKVSELVDVKANELYKEIGIRSHGKGLFHKNPVTGKSLGNKRIFWVKENLFIVNIVFAWEQAVGKTTNLELGMVASHRFPMFKPKENILDLDFIIRFFLTKKGKHLLNLASPGGAGRNKTLGQEAFNKLSIQIPTILEQKKIASFLTSIDRIIELKSNQVIKAGNWKKGLLQKMFI